MVEGRVNSLQVERPQIWVQSNVSIQMWPSQISPVPS